MTEPKLRIRYAGVRVAFSLMALGCLRVKLKKGLARTQVVGSGTERKISAIFIQTKDFVLDHVRAENVSSCGRSTSLWTENFRGSRLFHSSPLGSQPFFDT